MKLSLFGQLYLGTVAVLVLTAVVGLVIFENYRHQDSIDDFLRDVNRANGALIQQVINEGDPEPLDLLKDQPQCTEFCAQWLQGQSYQNFLSGVSRLEKSDNHEVFEFPDQVSMAVAYPLQQVQGYLLISDNIPLDDAERHSEHGDGDGDGDEADDEGRYLPWLLFLLGSVSVALILYYLSSRIEKAIAKLQQVVSLYEADHSLRANENSPEPINKLALSFNQLADQLDDQRQEQRVMMHAIAHELRTPLARMQLALGMIDNRDLPDNSAALLADLDRYVVGMDQLTKDVLTLGRVSEDSVDTGILNCINAGDFLLARLADLPLEQRGKITAEIENDVLIRISPTHLQLLLDNLLGNALVYADSEVRVALKTLNSLDSAGIGGIMLCIEDDGPGIAEAALDKLFVPFYRSDNSRDRKTGGFGLGLAIVHAIVKRYKGEIRVENRAGGGTVFTLSILHYPG